MYAFELMQVLLRVEVIYDRTTITSNYLHIIVRAKYVFMIIEYIHHSVEPIYQKNFFRRPIQTQYCIHYSERRHCLQLTRTLDRSYRISDL